jgi:hypothetical protein
MNRPGQWLPMDRAGARPGGQYDLLFIDSRNQICTMQIQGSELARLDSRIQPLALRLTDPGREPVQWLGSVLWNPVRGRVVKRAGPADPVVWADIGRNSQGQPRVRYRPRTGEHK